MSKNSRKNFGLSKTADHPTSHSSVQSTPDRRSSEQPTPDQRTSGQPINNGIYTITNVQQQCVIYLDDPTDQSLLSGHYNSKISSARWQVIQWVDGEYSIKNVDHGRYANCGSRARFGAFVEGHSEEQLWRIQERSEGQYTIAAIDSENLWMLPSMDEATPVELSNKYTDRRCWWTFEGVETVVPVNEKPIARPVLPDTGPMLVPSGDSEEPEDQLWNKINPDIEALKGIIGNHFNSSCQTEEPMNHGAYARVFLYTLQNGLKMVARVILPVRESIKTESEIAAMDMVRARTSVPVPKVHLYCSTPRNPVRAEWVLMDYVPGKRFVDCFEELSYGQKNKTATDMAFIMSEIFSFTSSQCGTLLRDQSLAGNQRSRRYNDVGSISMGSHSEISDGSFLIGPVNDVTFLEHTRIIPSAKCGPFSTERQFMEAFAYLGSPGTRPTDKLERWPFERLLEVYDVVRPMYPVSKGDLTTFHFSHGDLSIANILLDPKTGAITGVIDWEMAGFRPAWLAAACPTWFDDDSCRFVMEDHQDGPDGYGDETEDDAQLRQQFSSELQLRNQELFQHNRLGVELRAMFYNLCNQYPANVQSWLQQYEKYHWDVHARGPFPFDLMRWIEDRIDLYEQSRRSR